jgi:hypothetical protein
LKKKDYITGNSSQDNSRNADSSGGIPEHKLRSRNRESRLKARRRRQSRAIIVGGLIIAFVAFIVISLIVRMGEQEEVTPAPSESADYGNTVLLGRNSEGGINQILLFVPGDGGGSLYVIPSQTVLDVPGAGFQKLSSTLDSGNYQTLMQTLGDLFSLPVENYIEMSREAIEVAVERAGIINFKTDKEMRLGEDITLDSGDNMTASNRALSYLDAAQDDPQYWPQLQAMFYSGFLQAMAPKTEHEREEASAAIAGKTKGNLGKDDTSRLFLDLMSPDRPTSVLVLPVIISGEGDDWYYEPVPDQIEAMLLGSNLNASFNLEIRNGTQAAGMAEAAAAKLESLRYNMTVNSDSSEVNYDHTQVRCGSDDLEQCNNIQEYLGLGTVIKDELLEKNQIILILGKDYNPEVQ